MTGVQTCALPISPSTPPAKHYNPQTQINNHISSNIPQKSKSKSKYKKTTTTTLSKNQPTKNSRLPISKSSSWIVQDKIKEHTTIEPLWEQRQWIADIVNLNSAMVERWRKNFDCGYLVMKKIKRWVKFKWHNHQRLSAEINGGATKPVVGHGGLRWVSEENLILWKECEVVWFYGFFVCLFSKKIFGFMGLLEIGLVIVFMGLFLRFIYGLVSWIYFLFF